MTTATTEAVEKGLPKRARLHNDGSREFNHEVGGERYVIPPGEFIEVSRRVAVQIRGTYMGKDVPVSLRMEMITDGEYETEAPIADPEKERVVMFACPYCDNEYEKKEELREHMKSHRGGPKKKGSASE